MMNTFLDDEYIPKPFRLVLFRSVPFRSVPFIQPHLFVVAHSLHRDPQRVQSVVAGRQEAQGVLFLFRSCYVQHSCHPTRKISIVFDLCWNCGTRRACCTKTCLLQPTKLTDLYTCSWSAPCEACYISLALSALNLVGHIINGRCWV